MIKISLSNWFASDLSSSMPLYLVGGTVRDMLLGHVPKDLDLACRQAEELAAKTALNKNAALVSMGKKPGETCFRVIDRDDRDSFLDISEMRGETINDDLNHRDFTINAIAIRISEDGVSCEIIDPLNGMQDIRNRLVRMTDETAFRTDPLRILRAIRLSGQLGFSITKETLKEMELGAGLLNTAAAERIMTELMLMLKRPRSSELFREMERLGILRVIMPETEGMRGSIHDKFQRVDVLEHSMLVMEKCEEIINNLSKYFGRWADEVSKNLESNNRAHLLKFAAVLHDVGKPGTGRVEQSTERLTFHKHDREGARLVGLISRRLKMSNKESGFLVLMVSEHVRVLSVMKNDATDLRKARWFRRMGDKAIPAIILSMADVMAVSYGDSDEIYSRDYLSRVSNLISDYFEKIKVRLGSRDLVSGEDLKDLGMRPGPEIGNIISILRTAQDAGEIKSREEALGMVKGLLVRP